MKPKETQITGLFILGLITFIILSFAQIHSLVNYAKLTSLDSVTTFAVMDAIFFTVIKLLITLYIVFFLAVDIRGQFIQRERLRNKLETRIKRVIKDEEDPEPKKGDFIQIPNENGYTLQELVDEIKIQDESSKLNFEPFKTK